MKPNKLPKEKRNQLILILLMTAVVLAGLGFGLIRFQYANLARLADKKAEAERKLTQMQDHLKRSGHLDEELAEASKVLSDLEGGMASGDLYSWVINTIRNFKSPYKVEIPQFSPISSPTDVNLLPKFPYKQATLSVGGTAHYHDLGRFLADFENAFPHIRVANLDLLVHPTPPAGETEKLVFKLDIVTLVKPNPL